MNIIWSPYYSINADRLDTIVKMVRERRPELTYDNIADFILADWPEGKEHQEWLDYNRVDDEAQLSSIAGWVIAGYVKEE